MGKNHMVLLASVDSRLVCHESVYHVFFIFLPTSLGPTLFRVYIVSQQVLETLMLMLFRSRYAICMKAMA